MTPEADQVLNNFPEFFATTLQNQLWEAFKTLAPIFAPFILIALIILVVGWVFKRIYRWWKSATM